MIYQCVQELKEGQEALSRELKKRNEELDAECAHAKKFQLELIRVLGGPSDRPIIERIAALVTSCKVDEKILAELRAAAGLDRGLSIVEWAKNTRAEAELLRRQVGALKAQLDRLAEELAVTSCKVDENALKAQLDRSAEELAAVRKKASGDRRRAGYWRGRTNQLDLEVRRLKSDPARPITLTEPDRSDEELFLAYFPSILGWLAIHDPNRTRDAMLRSASDCCAEMVKLHRERLSSAPPCECGPSDGAHHPTCPAFKDRT